MCVKDLASIAAQLNKQLKKTACDKNTFTDDQMKNFEELKDRLKSTSVIKLSSTEKTFVFDANANAEQPGCVLLQEYNDESLRPVGYFSRTLNDAERNYGTTQRECVSMLWGVVMLRPYL